MFTVLLIISLSVFSLISLYNLFTAPVLKSILPHSKKEKLVSVLIPARNEENNIAKCIKGILSQDYQNKEIIILDDNSTDKTFEIASSFVSENIKLLKGNQLPSGWLGKNWACHQLSELASGDYLLFVDADVELNSEVISSAVSEFEKSNAVLLSIFPTQIIKSFGENLIVPLMNWLLLTFLPLSFVYSSLSQSFVAANGQFMLWRKEDYIKLGGHKIVKDKIVEDMELARLVKQNQSKVKTMLGGKLVFCRMYESFNQAYHGFTKNFFAGFSITPIFFLIIIMFFLTVFLSPLIILTSNFYSFIPLILVAAIRIAVSIRSNQNWLINIFLHPLQMLLMFWVGIVSVIKFETNQLIWKQRKL